MKTNNIESKFKHFHNNSNVFNMLEIQKDRNRIYQKDGYSPSKIQWFTLALLCTEILAAIIFLGLVLL